LAARATESRATRPCPLWWAPTHINERYGLFTLIVLGECVSAVTVAVPSAITGHGVSVSCWSRRRGALALIFGLWWSYFTHDAAGGLRASLAPSLGWGYGHSAVFGAVAALGAGLEVIIDTIEHASRVSATTAAFIVAIPVSAYLLIGGGLHVRMPRGRGVEWRPMVTTVILVLLAAVGAAVIALPAIITVMGVLAAGLVAANATRSS